MHWLISWFWNLINLNSIMISQNIAVSVSTLIVHIYSVRKDTLYKIRNHTCILYHYPTSFGQDESVATHYCRFA